MLTDCVGRAKLDVTVSGVECYQSLTLQDNNNTRMNTCHRFVTEILTLQMYLMIKNQHNTQFDNPFIKVTGDK